MEAVEGVVDVSVSCASGTAVCKIRPGTATEDDLVSALFTEGFESDVTR